MGQGWSQAPSLRLRHRQWPWPSTVRSSRGASPQGAASAAEREQGRAPAGHAEGSEAMQGDREGLHTEFGHVLQSSRTRIYLFTYLFSPGWPEIDCIKQLVSDTGLQLPRAWITDICQQHVCTQCTESYAAQGSLSFTM